MRKEDSVLSLLTQKHSLLGSFYNYLAKIFINSVSTLTECFSMTGYNVLSVVE